MFTSAKLAVLFTAVLSVAALPSHLARDSHVHREIAARVAQPEAAPVAQILARNLSAPAKRSTRKKRDGPNRCKQDDDSDVPSSTPEGNPQSTSTPSQEPPAATPSQNQNGGPKEDNVYPDPTTSTPTPTPTPSPTPSPTSDTGSGGGETHTGQGTFYETGLGACGITNTDSDFIAALSKDFFDVYSGYNGLNPNDNPVCNKKAFVTYQGKSVTVTLTDRCEACSMYDLDFSPAAFVELAPEATGRIFGMQWYIMD